MAAKKDSKTEVKAKRKQLTPEERVAKLEADLAEAKQRAAAKAAKVTNELERKIGVLRTRRDTLDNQIEALEAALAEATSEVECDTESEGNTESESAKG